MKVETTLEHVWLQQLVGEWTMEGESECGPDMPAHKSTGTESVRSLENVWVICEGKSSMPNGQPAEMIMTLGYDTDKAKFVGSWIGSMMSNLWLYEGELDASGNVLSLFNQGPSFTDPTRKANYKDVIEMKSSDLRTLTSYVQNEDGSWHCFMNAEYRRVK